MDRVAAVVDSVAVDDLNPKEEIDCGLDFLFYMNTSFRHLGTHSNKVTETSTDSHTL
jgi:hypothetical protein